MIQHFVHHRKAIQARRCFWPVRADCQPQEQQIPSPAATILTSQGRSPSRQQPALFAAFSSFNLQTQGRRQHMELQTLKWKASPVKEYWFTTTRKGKLGFLVPSTKSTFLHPNSLHIHICSTSQGINCKWCQCVRMWSMKKYLVRPIQFRLPLIMQNCRVWKKNIYTYICE